MNLFVFVLLGIGLLLSIVSWWGRRTNLAFAKRIAAELEQVFRPIDMKYINIGGVIGFHFQYELAGALNRLTGTVTLFPRQSLFYYPIARLRGREDELSLMIGMPGLPVGDGHIVSRARLQTGRIDIEDAGQMQQRDLIVDGHELVVLSHNRVVEDYLSDFAQGCPEVRELRHFAYSTVNNSFYLLVEPRLERVGLLLEYWVGFLADLKSRYDR